MEPSVLVLYWGFSGTQTKSVLPLGGGVAAVVPPWAGPAGPGWAETGEAEAVNAVDSIALQAWAPWAE